MPESLTNESSPVGLLVIGHGTRDSSGLAEFAKVVQEVEKQIRPIPVQAAFLELATPTISAGLEQLIERGIRRVVVSPLLLFTAGHARQDIPAAVDVALQRHPEIEWRQADSLGCHPALLELSHRRFGTAIQRHSVDLRRSRLILVGRGSHDLMATQETARYGKLLAERVGIEDWQVAFLAMAEPRLSAMLAEAAVANWDTVIVQPHLLFHGELLEDIHRQVDDWRSRVAGKQWILTEHLGAEPEVVAAVIERCVDIC